LEETSSSRSRLEKKKLFRKNSVFISIALRRRRRRRRRSSSSFEPVHFVGSCVGITFAFFSRWKAAWGGGRRRGVVEFPTTGL